MDAHWAGRHLLCCLGSMTGMLSIDIGWKIWPVHSLKLLHDYEGDRGNMLHKHKEVRPRKLQPS